MRKIIHENGNRKQVGIGILTSDKIDFKTKLIRGLKKVTSYLEIIEKQDIMILTIYAPTMVSLLT